MSGEKTIETFPVVDMGFTFEEDKVGLAEEVRCQAGETGLGVCWRIEDFSGQVTRGGDDDESEPGLSVNGPNDHRSQVGTLVKDRNTAQFATGPFRLVFFDARGLEKIKEWSHERDFPRWTGDGALEPYVFTCSSCISSCIVHSAFCILHSAFCGSINCAPCGHTLVIQHETQKEGQGNGPQTEAIVGSFYKPSVGSVERDVKLGICERRRETVVHRHARAR